MTTQAIVDDLMGQALERVQEVLEAGMTTGQDSSELWYVKTWTTHDPMVWKPADLPLGLLKPGDETRQDQYVQEDTAISPLTVYFFPMAISRSYTASEASRRCTALVGRAISLIRANPTFDARVIDCKVSGSNFRQPGFIAREAIHSAELQLRVSQRAPW